MSGTAEQRELSDSLGVSSALYLSASDVLKLRAMLEEPNDLAYAQRVLRRLSMVPMTIKLDETTGFVAFLAGLSSEETVQAAVQAGAEGAEWVVTIIARIVSTWRSQLDEEQEQRELARQDSKAAAASNKSKRFKDPNCAACQGRHRPHTCK